MLRKIAERLQRLDDKDPGELRAVLLDVRRRQLVNRLRRLPYPVRLAIGNTIILPVLLLVSPPIKEIKAIFVPLIWMGSYSITIAVAAIFDMLNHRKSGDGESHPRAHWAGGHLQDHDTGPLRM